jgi:hypothetical protein
LDSVGINRRAEVLAKAFRLGDFRPGFDRRNRVGHAHPSTTHATFPSTGGCNLPALRQVGFQANRRILKVERLGQHFAVGPEAMLKLNFALKFRSLR